MNIHPSLPARSGRLLVGALLAVLMLAIGTSVGPTQSASANEFVPKPKITYLAQCYNLHQGLHVTFVLSNEGLGNATFHLVKTIDGVTTTEDFNVGFTPATPEYYVLENQVSTFEVTSTDGEGAHWSYTFGAVDCEADPSASVAVLCPAEPGGTAQLEYTYFNPSAYSAQFSFGVPEAPNFEITAADMVAPATEHRDVAEGTEVDVVVTADSEVVASLHTTVDCVDEQATTTTTTTEQPTTTTTTEQATTTSTTMPATTTTTVDEPTTTVADDPTTTVDEPTSSTTGVETVVVSGDDTMPPQSFDTLPSDQPATLARTGTESTRLGLIGLALVGLGIFVITARRLAR